MLKSLIPVIAFLTVVACAAQQETISFFKAQAGDLAQTSNLSVIGVLDTTGVNFYSLFADENERQGTDCIPLILERDDQILVKQFTGRRAKVIGSAIPMNELNQAMPNEYGETNGREWSGTRCTGRLATFVTELRTLD